MALLNLGIAKTDVARLTADGTKHLHYPSLGVFMRRAYNKGCNGCLLKSSHNVCDKVGFKPPFGETKYQRVSTANKILKQDVDRIQGALFLLHYIANGYIGDGLIYNVGNTANNGSNIIDYEITAVSGTTLTLKGKNPKKIIQSVSVENPNWPSDGGPRLLTQEVSHLLPLGASIEFRNSALSGKNNPLILGISPPASNDLDNVTFDVLCSNDVSSAMEPLDLAYPPVDGKYYCRVRYEAANQSRYYRLQNQMETQFSPKSVTFTTAGINYFLNSSFSNTRVLYPNMAPNKAMTVEFAGGALDGVKLTDAEITELLTTEQYIEAGIKKWRSSINLTGLSFTTCSITYWAQSVSSDTTRMNLQASCSNNQSYGSYEMDTGLFCTAKAEASQIATYNNLCWQPDCSHFAIGTNEGFGTKPMPLDDFDDSALFSSLWHRADWIIQQGIPGVSSYRNFSIYKPAGAGPSIEGLLGSVSDRLYEGFYATKEELNPRPYGRRVEYTSDGNTRQILVNGAFFLEGYDLSAEGGTDERHVAGAYPNIGIVSQYVPLWATKVNQLGTAETSGLELFPWRGNGGTSLVDFSNSGNGLALVQTKKTASEKYLTAIDLTDENTEFTALIRSRFV